MNYHLIDMANIIESDIQLVNQAFAVWRSIYKQELEIRGLTLHEEDFWNCRLLGIIESDGQIIATLFSNIFDLRSQVVESHRYFKDISLERIESFRQQGLQRFMSMEYLLVNPNFRGHKSTVNWAEVIVGLGFNALLNSSCDAVVGIGREDKKVSRIFVKMGGVETDFLIKNQTPCRVVVMPKNDYHEHENAKTRRYIETLWAGKQNHATNLVGDGLSPLRVVAA